MDYATLGVLRPSGLRRKPAAKAPGAGLRKPSYGPNFGQSAAGLLVCYMTLAPGWPSFCILTSIVVWGA